MIITDRFLTVREVALILKVSPQTVYKLVEKGELACYLISKVKRFRMVDINRYLKKQKNLSAKRDTTNRNYQPKSLHGFIGFINLLLTWAGLAVNQMDNKFSQGSHGR